MLSLKNLAALQRIEACDQPQPAHVSILLPVLNEAERIGNCLRGLVKQPAEVREILVIDGGSTDGTRVIVERYRRSDSRIKLLDATPVDESWTGKSWGLNFGLLNSSSNSQWILCVDADVEVSPLLVRSLLAHARRTGISTFSVAARQRLSGPIDGLIHPALLTTLVYRFGPPGGATRDPHNVQANGQCFISRRETLIQTQAFARAQASLCEDITIARRLAECGEAVGFYEADVPVEVTMYPNWRETWRNWPRSLPMRDQYFGWREVGGLIRVLVFQALPLPVFVLAWIFGAPLWIVVISALFLLARIGILVGVARAYPRRVWSYWLSPLFDLPVVLRVIASALARHQTWRGRSYLRRKGGRFEPAGTRVP
ncbi:MAG TPA: glycosyltransferase family 2 protein [Candidatus Binatia bacterium]|nr:glycosyltransferase family 2 protein [Candidatus Binatia bacterium]